jgi:hypothetical protein
MRHEDQLLTYHRVAKLGGKGGIITGMIEDLAAAESLLRKTFPLPFLEQRLKEERLSLVWRDEFNSEEPLA